MTLPGGETQGLIVVIFPMLRHLAKLYHNDPKFSDRHAWANSEDADQTAPSVCIVWTHYSIVEPHSSK